MDIDKYKSWTEFEWEQELREEDKRVNAYINELATCLDMPDEDRIISERLSQNNHFISARLWENFEFDPQIFEGSETLMPEIDRHTELYFFIGREASSFGKLMASLRKESIEDGLAILFIYGRIMSVYLDIIHLDGNEFTSLKAALYKRLYKYINTLMGRISDFEARHENDGVKHLSPAMDNLHKIREEIYNIRFARENK